MPQFDREVSVEIDLSHAIKQIGAAAIGKTERGKWYALLRHTGGHCTRWRGYCRLRGRIAPAAWQAQTEGQIGSDQPSSAKVQITTRSIRVLERHAFVSD